MAIDTCPTSYVSGESRVLIQEFQAWKVFGSSDVLELPARTVEAFCILDNELRAEMKNER